MTKWAPKPVPLLNRGRLQHFAFGAGASVLGGILGGDHGAGIGGTIGIGIGLSWELATPKLAPHSKRIFGKQWDYPHADYIDYVSFILGAVAAVGVRAVLT